MDKCTVIAKKELLYTGPFGLAAYLCGLIFIPRVHSDKAKTIMNLAIDKIKPGKVSVAGHLGQIINWNSKKKN